MSRIEPGPEWRRKSNIFVNTLALFFYVGVTLLVIAAIVYWLPEKASIYITVATPIVAGIIIYYWARRV